MRLYLQHNASTFLASHKPIIGALVAIASMIAAALLLHPAHHMDYLVLALVAMGIGVLALAYSGRNTDTLEPPRRREAQEKQGNVGSAIKLKATHQPSATIRWQWVLLGTFLLLMVAENNAMRFMPKWYDYFSYHVQFALFVVGVGLVIFGMSGRLKGQPRLGILQVEEWLLLILLFIIALIPRVVALDTLVRTLVDELPWVDGIRELWWRSDYELLRPMSGTFPFTSLFPYVEAGFVQVFGRNLVGLRLASSVTGALTVIALYGLARHLFNRTTAVIAAFLLAVFPPHIHFSRLALLNMVDALPGTLALAWAARGLRYDRRLDWALAGAALGLTHYFFEAGRLLFTPLMVVWMGWLFVFDRALFRARWHGIRTMALVALIVALPVYYVLGAQGASLAGRLDQSRLDTRFILDVIAGNRQPEELLNHILTPFLMYVNRPDSVAYYGGDQALILSGLVPLALLGAAFVLLCPRRPTFVLLIWLAAVAVGNMLLKNPAVAARYVTALPPLALLMAVGLHETTRLVANHIGVPVLARGLRVALWLALPLLALVQLTYYFGPHLDRFNIQNRQLKLYGDGVDVALRAAELPLGTHVFIIGEPVHDSNVPAHFLNFLGDDRLLASLTPQEISHRYLAELPTDRPYAFFIEATDAHTLNLLLYYFVLSPARISPYYADIPLDRQYILYFAPVGAARAVERDKTAEMQRFTPPAE